MKTIMLVLLLCVALTAQAAELRTIPDRTQIGLEESFTLELRATGSVDGSPDLSVLEKDFELLGHSQSSQIQIINGEITRTASWTIALLPRSVASDLIPPLCIGSDCSEPVAIEVSASAKQRDGASDGNELLLEVSAEPAQLRVQSQLLYRVRLLTRVGFVQASLSDPDPSGVEVVLQKLGDDRDYETRRDGLRYRVIERLYAIFPQQSGQLIIPPLRFDAQVSAGRGGNYPFNARVRQLRKRSERISLEVLPALQTDGRPWLPATDLQLEDDWQQRPPQLTVGEPATRTLTLRAAGLPSAQLPLLQLDVPEGFKSYPDQPNREDQVGTDGISGALQQKLALVPTRPGRFTLPEISVDWWDVQAERWRQARLPQLELEVLPAAGQPALVPPAVQPSQPAVVPLIAPPAEPRQEVVSPGFWPWLSLALAVGWLATGLLILRSRRRVVVLPPGKDEDPQCLQSARRELLQVLQADRSDQLRNALLVWGQALYPEARLENLEQLAALGGEPLAQQLEIFNRSRYRPAGEPWDSRILATALSQAEKGRATKKASGLPSLYPG